MISRRKKKEEGGRTMVDLSSLVKKMAETQNQPERTITTPTNQLSNDETSKIETEIIEEQLSSISENQEEGLEMVVEQNVSPIKCTSFYDWIKSQVLLSGGNLPPDNEIKLVKFEIPGIDPRSCVIFTIQKAGKKEVFFIKRTDEIMVPDYPCCFFKALGDRNFHIITKKSDNMCIRSYILPNKIIHSPLIELEGNYICYHQPVTFKIKPDIDLRFADPSESQINRLNAVTMDLLSGDVEMHNVLKTKYGHLLSRLDLTKTLRENLIDLASNQLKSKDVNHILVVDMVASIFLK